jgi:hypothetical protein
MAGFPWKVALVGGGALLALLALSGDSSADTPPPTPPNPNPKPPPGPGPKVADMPVPSPPPGPTYSATTLASGFLRAAPHEDARVIQNLPAGTPMIEFPATLQKDTPKSPGGWVGAYVATGNGALGWVSVNNLSDATLVNE